MNLCYFRGIGYPGCDGPMTRAHIIPQQRMKQAGIEKEMLDDERCWVHACLRHHHQWDHGFIELHPDDFPPGIWTFMDEIHFYWDGDRKQFRALAKEQT